MNSQNALKIILVISSLCMGLMGVLYIGFCFDQNPVSVTPQSNSKVISNTPKFEGLDRYYVNKNAQKNGDHEVHTARCRYLPKEKNRLYLGEFSNCEDAVQGAKKHFLKANGGFFCSRPCDTK